MAEVYALHNAPGVPGIGQKGAATLLEKSGDVPTILEHVEELGPVFRGRSGLVDRIDPRRSPRR